MSDTFGPTSALPLMRYDLDSSSWRTSEATSLWDLEMSSPTFPEWGMTRGGECYELPRPELRTVAPASSLLPSPISRDHKEQTLGWTWQRDGVTQEDTLPRAITSLLPTPTGDDANNLTRDSGTFQSLTRSVVTDLLPTPTATDVDKHAGQPRHKRIGHQPRIADVIEYLPQWSGDDTPPPSSDGSASSDGQLLLLPSTGKQPGGSQ